MLVVGLTGGIGSGKSTFSALLAERGAHVIDADVLGREALRPGRPAWHSVVDQFGDEILSSGSLEIDRKRLADIVFNDRDALSALNAIIHPRIVRAIADELDRLRDTDEIVVIDAALILELGLREALDALIAVTADPSLRRQRLYRDRAMTLEEFHGRAAAQKPAEEIIESADIVVRNEGSLEDLVAEADRVWTELEAMREAADR